VAGNHVIAIIGGRHRQLVILEDELRAFADESGRRRPVAVQGSEYELPLDVAIIAVGTSSNPLVQSTTPDIQTRKGGSIEANPDTLKTSKPGVFAAGDIVTGGATVILAMGAGRKAAKAMDEYLQSGQR
jgi:glutamate synthase (NADPH/NADH) small chain